MTSSLEKANKDFLNWIQSELKEEKKVKLTKYTSPYREDKIKFLEKVIKKFKNYEDNKNKFVARAS